MGNLTPEDGEFIVTATLTAPDTTGDYAGVVKIHAVGDPSDSCEIPITLTVSKSKEMHSPIKSWLDNHPLMFPLLRLILNL